MKFILATRKSPLALAQTALVAARLQEYLPDMQCEQLRVVTTGDRQAEWSLEKQGGKGLFTAELEQALLRGEANAAVHSSKDLPGEMTPGLVLAGFLPREDPRDVLVLREGAAVPQTIATGSPRRRLQLARLFPGVSFSELRGNVDTRLRKIASGAADATVLAAAGMKRLGIAGWPGLTFRFLDPGDMVPAVGQGAIAVQCRTADAAFIAGALDAETGRLVGLERALLAKMGGGCQVAFAAHAAGDALWVFHGTTGVRRLPLTADDYAQPMIAAARILHTLELHD
ncbi:MAG: hydroxymethylbilane synthase [Opitutaceae bacterium]|nr:hydroxymethylbilane synthase [Opitutaceae bacterium]